MIESQGARIARLERLARTDDRLSPFLPLGQVVRIAFLYYLFAYRILFPIVDIMMADGSKDLLGARILAEFYYTCLMAYPFIFYRKEYGWLHPLVLPTMFVVAKAIAKSPFSLFLPFDYPIVNFTVETNSPAAVLALSNYDLAMTRLQFTLVNCFAQSVYLLVFLFGPKFPIPSVHMRDRPPNLTITALVFIGLMVGAAFMFIIAKGGISELLIGMRGGRRALFEGNGHLITAGVLAPTIALLWFAADKNPWRNPLLLAGMAGALMTALLVSGSRSSMIMPVLSLVLIWWWKRGRALILPTVLVGVFGLFVIGAFGSIRQDYHSSSIDLSVLQLSNFGTTMSTALEDIEGREANEEVLAVMAGANQKGLLWGKTYLNAVTFWVPRALWKDKPVGTDVYNMWINFNGNEIDSDPSQLSAWGMPVSAEMESYWNFGLFGVVLLFGFLGILNSTFVKAAYIYRKAPLFWILYINTVINNTGTTKEFISLILSTSVILVFALVAGFFSGAQENEGRVALPRLRTQT